MFAQVCVGVLDVTMHCTHTRARAHTHTHTLVHSRTITITKLALHQQKGDIWKPISSVRVC